MNRESTSIEQTQRTPLFKFYVSALVFAGALVFASRLRSPWPRILYAVMLATSGFAVWTLFRFLKVADERQRRTNFRSLRFAFVAGLVLSLFGGFVQGFGVLHVTWIGVLGLQLIPWSFGLIYYSWRHQ